MTVPLRVKSIKNCVKIIRKRTYVTFALRFVELNRSIQQIRNQSENNHIPEESTKLKFAPVIV